VVPGTSFPRGAKILLPATGPGTQRTSGGGAEGSNLLTMLVPTWYGVSLSQSADGGRSWGPPSPFFPHGRHKESVEVTAKRVGGATVEVGFAPCSRLVAVFLGVCCRVCCGLV